MTDAQKRILVMDGMFPLAGATAAYYLLAIAAAKVLQIPSPQLKSILKTVPSWVADKLDISFIAFRLPAEYAADITAKTGLVSCSINSYCHFADGLVGGWIYSYFPPFFLIMLAGCVIYATAKMGGLSPEKQRKNQKYLRGTRKVDAGVFVQKSHTVRDPATVIRTKSGKLVISDKKLREHTLILGTTGSGKSQLILNYLRDILRGDVRVIAVDRKGEFWSHFGQPGKDVLFHPYDRRGVSWSIFDEINVQLDGNGELTKMPTDIKAITSILFQLPSRKGENVFWYSAAAAVANSAICYCIINHKTTTRELLQVLTRPAPELDRMFATLPPALQVGRQAIGDAKGKQAASVLAICSTVMDTLEPFADMRGGWSCRDWINNGSGNLYISTAGKNDTLFSGAVGLIVDLIGRELKQFEDDGSGKTRVLFVIDELGSYPPLSTLVWLLTLGRSKGVAVIMANQTISKLRKVYGNEECYNLISNAKTKYIFQLPEPSDAEYASRMVGSAEVERVQRSENRGTGMLGKAHADSNNNSKQITTDAPFLPADIQNLQVGQAITIEPNLLPLVALLQYLPVADCPARIPEFEPDDAPEVSAAALSAMAQDAAVGREQSAEREQNEVSTSPMDAPSSADAQNLSASGGFSGDQGEKARAESPTSGLETSARPATPTENGENPQDEDTDADDGENEAGQDWEL